MSPVDRLWADPRTRAVRARAQDVWDHPVAGPVVKVVLGYLLLVEVAVQLVFGQIDLGIVDFGRRSAPIPRAVFLDGIIMGSLYGLVAMGLILVYRANRIINFAAAQLGAVPAVLALLLIAKKDVPYLVVVPLVLVGSALLGAATDVVVIRRFAKSPRLILTVATIGVAFVMQVAEFYVKKGVTGDLLESVQLTFPTPFDDLRFRIGPQTFSGDHIFAVVVVAIIVVAVGAFFRFTDMGIAVRASAENGERASLLGIPVRRVSTVVWAMAAVLSGIGIFVRTPLVGLPLGTSVGLSILLFGLVAAVIGRMESLPAAVLGGMFVGIVDRAALFSTRRASLAIAAMVPVVLVALLAQRKKMSRALEGETSTWQAVKEVRPIPAELSRLPEILRARAAMIAIGIAVAVALPFVASQEAGLATRLVVYSIVGVSLVILTGWSGQISLGQFAIAGVGAAVAGGLAATHHWDFFLTLVVAGVAGAAVAILIGLPALRIQGLFLAVTTLTFAFAVEAFVLRREWFGWLLPEDGAFVEPPILYERFDTGVQSEVLGVTLGFEQKLYFLSLVFLGLAILAARSLRKNRSGRILIGVRDNGRLMQAFGVNLARSRLAAFAISGFIAAIGGALFAYQQGSIDGSTYSPDRSITLFVMTVIGGMGSLTGALLGAGFVLGLPLLPGIREIDQIDLLLQGFGMLLLLMFLPGGLAEGVFRLRDRFLRRVAAKHQIHVPSLIADSRVEHEEQRESGEHLLHAAADHAAALADGRDGELIGCPACGARIPVHEAALHEHFVVDLEPETSPNGDRARAGTTR